MNKKRNPAKKLPQKSGDVNVADTSIGVPPADNNAGAVSPAGGGKAIKFWRLVAYGLYLLLFALPILQIILRQFNASLISIDNYLAHILLFVGFIGGILAAGEGRHLAVGTAQMFPVRVRKITDRMWRVIALIILGSLFIGSIELALIGFTPADSIGGLPLQLIIMIMPIGYLVMCIRFARQLWAQWGGASGSSEAGNGSGSGVRSAARSAARKVSERIFPGAAERKRRSARTSASIAIAASVIASVWLAWGSLANLVFLLDSPPLFFDNVLIFHIKFFDFLTLPLILLLIWAAFAGLPLFLVLGSIATVLFAANGLPSSLIVNEGYNMLTNPAIPAIPLFTLAGYILSTSRASERLINFFRQVLGWLPGGLIITSVIASAFFTSFTGSSGVTILALGGILFPMLSKSGEYNRGFSRGLLTSSSNIGLLFPPSLAIILYGTIAQINILHVFLGALLPGVLMLITFSTCRLFIPSRVRGTGAGAPARAAYQFNARELFTALREAGLELLMPVVVLVSLFTGLVTLVESAAIAVLYALVVEMFIKREVTPEKLIGAIRSCLLIMGGILMILATARGLAYFIIDAQVPTLLSGWVEANISSRFVFLIILNLILLVTGCFMDIFSAILIVAPLVIPLGGLFDVHPVHLAVIFLANLGAGFITPPVGIDLFLASYRFEKPLTKIYRNVFPFFLLEFAIVLIITYVPWISTALLSLAERGGGY